MSVKKEMTKISETNDAIADEISKLHNVEKNLLLTNLKKKVDEDLNALGELIGPNQKEISIFTFVESFLFGVIAFFYFRIVIAESILHYLSNYQNFNYFYFIILNGLLLILINFYWCLNYIVNLKSKTIFSTTMNFQVLKSEYEEVIKDDENVEGKNRLLQNMIMIRNAWASIFYPTLKLSVNDSLFELFVKGGWIFLIKHRISMFLFQRKSKEILGDKNERD